MVCRWKIQICISPSVQGRTTLPDVLNLVQPPVDTVFFQPNPSLGLPVFFDVFLGLPPQAQRSSSLPVQSIRFASARRAAQVYRPGSAALAKLLLREGGVRFVVAWPSCSLESLEPPAVVLVTWRIIVRGGVRHLGPGLGHSLVCFGCFGAVAAKSFENWYSFCC